MRFFKRSDDDVHGFVRYSVGLAAIVITMTCVAGANILSEVALNGSMPTFASLVPKAVPTRGTLAAQDKPRRPVDIDYGSTASISSPGGVDNFLAHPIILDPCTGRQK